MKKFVYLVCAVALLSAVAVFAGDSGLEAWRGTYGCDRAVGSKQITLDFEGKLPYLKVVLGNGNYVEGSPVVSFNAAEGSYTAKLNFQVVKFFGNGQVSSLDGTESVGCARQ